MRSIIVIGQGSAGLRHARLARDAGLNVGVVSRRPLAGPGFATIEESFQAGTPDGVIIATETADHAAALRSLAGLRFNGRVLVEKPLSRWTREVCAPTDPANVWVAYNLRFHPGLKRLRQAVIDRPVLSVTIKAGQDLRDWRPGRNLMESYSASVDGGGGVLRDLSHELDYASWLFGPWRRLVASGGRCGPLPIASDSVWHILVDTDTGSRLSIQLDYYSTPAERRIAVVLADETITVDLVAGTYRDASGTHLIAVDRDQTYRAQIDAFCGIPHRSALCDWRGGLEVMQMIEAVEQSAETGQWIAR